MGNSYKVIPTDYTLPVNIPEHCPFCDHDVSIDCVFSCQSKAGRV